MNPFIALLCLFAGLGYFALIALLRVRDFRARFVNLPVSGDTSPGGFSAGVFESSLL